VDLTVANLMLGVVFGSLGMGYFIYGKKEQRLMPLLVGIALMVYPYFVPEVWEIIVVGIALCAIPFLVRI
jgi:hypothetical protein